MPILSSPENGFNAVTDYKVYSNESGSMIEYLSTTANQTTVTLTVSTTGLVCSFKVLALNSYGDGDLSTQVDILAAVVPAKMNQIVISSSGTNLVLTWTAPDNRGSTITGYEVRLLDKNDNTFKDLPSICDYSLGLTCTFSMDTAQTLLGYE